MRFLYRWWIQSYPGKFGIAPFERDVFLGPKLLDDLERFVGELTDDSPAITHRWAGIFGTTPDRLPLVGPLPGHEGVWVCAGYSGHGNVMGLACGELVAQAILGQEPPELALFEPARLLAV